MATGVVVSCIPTLGPVFFRERQATTAAANAAFQDWSSKAKLGPRPLFSGSTSHAGSKDRAFGGMGFTKMSSDDVELVGAAKGMGYHASVNRSLTSRSASQKANPGDAILVSKGYAVSTK